MAFQSLDLNPGPPEYGHKDYYLQSNGTAAVNTVTTQPPAAMATNAIVVQPLDQERPSHGLAMGSLVCAVLTLVISGGMAAFCAIPAIVLSVMAIAQDYRVDQAKTMSLISLALSAVYWVLAVVAAVVIVIVVVITANQDRDQYPDIIPPDYSIWGLGN